jgi:predicted dehydrogenase
VRTPVSVGVVGGLASAEELARTFDCLPEGELRWLCSERRPLLPTLPRQRGVRHTSRFSDLLEDEKLDAVVIAAPVAARADLVDAALQADKHVYVEGVPAQVAKQAGTLLRLAQARGRCLVSADAIHGFDPAVQRLRLLLKAGELGEVLYLHADRHVLGRTPDEDDLLWGPGADEVALVLHLLADEPVSVEARGESYLDVAAPDLQHWRLAFATGIVAQLQLSALDARPGARLALVGSRATAVLERFPPRLSVHSKVGADHRSEGTTFSVGDVVSPRVACDDPIRRSCEAFLAMIRSTVDVPGYGGETVAVVETLEQLQRSLRRAASVELGRARPPHDLRVVGLLDPAARTVRR